MCIVRRGHHPAEHSRLVRHWTQFRARSSESPDIERHCFNGASTTWPTALEVGVVVGVSRHNLKPDAALLLQVADHLRGILYVGSLPLIRDLAGSDGLEIGQRLFRRVRQT